MNEESEITINLDEFLSIISEIESIDVKIADEDVQLNLTEINKNLTEYIDYIKGQELTPDEILLIEEQENLNKEEISLINENLEQLNTNVLNLTTSIETTEITEMDELQVKSYGSNVLVFYLFVVYLFTKLVFSIFNFFGKNI